MNGRVVECGESLGELGEGTMGFVGRRVLDILAVVSLLLCVATGVLWVRSYWVGDVVSHVGVSRGASVWVSHMVFFSQKGRLVWVRNSFRDGKLEEGARLGFEWKQMAESNERAELFHWSPRDGTSWWNRLGFDVEWLSYEGPFGQRTIAFNTQGVMIPHAGVVIASGVLPVIWGWRGWRRRRRVRRGLCVECGYDLRASGERCPECGRPTAKAETR